MQTTFYWPRGGMPSPDKHAPERDEATVISRDTAQRASVAQLLLVARLKARNRRDLAMDTLERGAHVMWVTCKSWFSSGQPPPAAGSDDDTIVSNNNNKDTDAHRDH